jgi:hypothetical protein
VLSFDGGLYKFAYLDRAKAIDGFRPLLGFEDLDYSYESDGLFPLFAQRAMDPRRPDYGRYISELALDETSTPWEQIARSGGTREGDTLQLFPVPRFSDGAWKCFFLASGVRYLLKKSVMVDGVPRGSYEPEALEKLLNDLEPGDVLQLEAEPDNEWSRFALLVTTEGGEPLGYVPQLLVEALNVPHSDHKVHAKVEQVNPLEAGWHMRLLVEMTADLDASFEFFSEAKWPMAGAQ